MRFVLTVIRLNNQTSVKSFENTEVHRVVTLKELQSEFIYSHMTNSEFDEALQLEIYQSKVFEADVTAEAQGRCTVGLRFLYVTRII